VKATIVNNPSLWIIEFSEEAQKQFRKIDKTLRTRIENFLMMRLARHPEPKALGAPLTGDLGSFWRFRVGDYRIIADIMEDRLVIHVLKIGHRRHIYD